MVEDSKLAFLKSKIKKFPDYPKPGILFYDIFGIFSDKDGLQTLCEVLEDKAKQFAGKIDKVAGLDSRGFLIGPIMARALNVPFIPIRKKGKLPPEVVSTEYATEYSTAAIEIHKEHILKGDRVLIVDDLIATGGTLQGSIKLLNELEAVIVGVFLLIEIRDLEGSKKLNVPCEALFTF